MPEYFAGMSGSRVSGEGSDRLPSPAAARLRHTGPPVLVVPPSEEVSESQETTSLFEGSLFEGGSPEAAERGESLGHQYLFGFIPFTNVFFQHGLESLAVELSHDILEQNGYAPFIAARSDAAAAAWLLRPSAMLMPRIEQAEIDAYDALFVRIISIDGEMGVSVLRSEPDSSVREIKRTTEPFEETKVRRFALGPTLSYFFESSARDALQEALRRSLTPGVPRATAAAIRRSREAVGGNPHPVTVVAKPVFSSAPPEAVGELFASSYGFFGMPPYGQSSLARLLQRGLAGGLKQSGLRVVAAGSEAPRVNSRRLARSGGALLRTTIDKLTSLDPGAAEPEGLELTVRFQLTVGDPATESLRNDRSWLCRTTVARAEGVDGDWVVGLEAAAYALAADLRRADRAGNSSGYCRPLTGLR